MWLLVCALWTCMIAAPAALLLERKNNQGSDGTSSWFTLGGGGLGTEYMQDYICYNIVHSRGLSFYVIFSASRAACCVLAAGAGAGRVAVAAPCLSVPSWLLPPDYSHTNICGCFSVP